MARPIVDAAHQPTLQRADAAKPPALDRRKAERLPLALQLTYTLTLSGGSLEGRSTTTNVSGGGLQFVVPQMVPCQTVCQVTFTVPQRTQPFSFQGQVRWCRQGSGAHRKQCEVSVEFTSPSSYDDAAFADYSQFIATQLLVRYLR